MLAMHDIVARSERYHSIFHLFIADGEHVVVLHQLGVADLFIRPIRSSSSTSQMKPAFFTSACELLCIWRMPVGYGDDARLVSGLIQSGNLPAKFSMKIPKKRSTDPKIARWIMTGRFS